MIDAEVVWHGDEVMRSAAAPAWDRMKRAATLLWETFQETVSKANQKPYTRTPPGDPPRMRTGKGRKGIVLELDKATMTAVIRVLPEAHYMAILDQSTRLNHPWREPAAKSVIDKMQAIMAGK